MTALLIDNLPLLTGAPTGIKKLRELIIELAVRGRLVPQDSSDEPASELLRRIAYESTRIVTEGKAKKGNLKACTVAESVGDCELPVTWTWTKFDDLIDPEYSIAYGVLVPGPDVTNGVPFVRIADLDLVSPPQKPEKSISPEVDRQFERTRIRGGEILMGVVGSIGKLGIAPESWAGANIARAICRIVPSEHISKGYIVWLLQSELMRKQFLGDTRTLAQPTLNIGLIRNATTPLPPLAEQHRIVVKVDQLMDLCDRLESKQADAESAHAQLVQGLLGCLTKVHDAAEFAADWQRLVEHFHTLFTTEPSIDALKQTLLQMAVMGKLVPQDPNDEPASELLKRIAMEKTRLVAEGKLKKQKPPTPIGEDEIAFKLPQGWQWVRKAEVFNFLNGYAFKSEWFQQEGVRLLRNVNVSHGVVNWKEAACISEEQAADFHGFSLKENDVVLTLDRPIISSGLKYAVIRDTDLPCLLLQRVAKIAPYADAVSVHYLSAWLNSRFFVNNIDPGRSNGVPHISTSQVASMPFALPPLPEQHRIIAKIDQLMALCDQLKIHLTQARQLNEQLTSTLVERALSEDGQQTPIATDQQLSRTLLAAEITHRLHSQRTFGQRKLQKVIYLAEHAARLAAIQGDYLRDAAGPHDRRLMNKVEGELQNHQWYERIERETVGHAYRPLSQAGLHRQAYCSTWPVAERAAIEQVIELMRDWDTDRCEMTVTLYAAWNDFILEGRPVTDEAIVEEVMLNWNDTKLRFGKIEWLAVLAEMKKHKILMPTGFGKRTRGGMLSLPGFE
jgi:type I restriction enzyme S subunit